MKPICAPRAKAKECAGVSLCIPKITRSWGKRYRELCREFHLRSFSAVEAAACGSITAGMVHYYQFDSGRLVASRFFRPPGLSHSPVPFTHDLGRGRILSPLCGGILKGFGPVSLESTERMP